VSREEIKKKRKGEEKGQGTHDSLEAVKVWKGTGRVEGQAEGKRRWEGPKTWAKGERNIKKRGPAYLLLIR
jgi:hypothetical protein